MSAAEFIHSGKLFINGRYEDGASGKTFDVINPATGELLTTVPDGDARDVDRAVAAARASFEKKSLARNGSVEEGEDPVEHLRTAGEAQGRAGRARSRWRTARRCAKPRGADVDPAVDAFRYYAGWVRKIYGETIPVDGPFLNYTLREPVGVVGAIVPWNYPLHRGVESCAGAGLRLFGGAEAIGDDAADRVEAGRNCMRSGAAGGRAQRGHRLRRRRPARRWRCHMDVDKISFTGQHRERRGALLKASAESNLKRAEPGTRRQVSEHRLPGCRYGRGDQVGVLRHFREQGRDLQRRLAPVAAAGYSRPVSGTAGGARAKR